MVVIDMSEDIKPNLDNEYRKINARLVRMHKKYGENFGLYQEQAATIHANFNTYINEDGVIQIKRGAANKNINKFQKKALEIVAKSGSVKSEQATAKKYLQEEMGIDKPTKEQIDELVIKRDYVRSNKNMITFLSEQVDIGRTLTDTLANLYNRAAGRSDELTYDELYDLMKKAEPAYKKAQKKVQNKVIK